MVVVPHPIQIHPHPCLLRPNLRLLRRQKYHFLDLGESNRVKDETGMSAVEGMVKSSRRRGNSNLFREEFRLGWLWGWRRRRIESSTIQLEVAWEAKSNWLDSDRNQSGLNWDDEGDEDEVKDQRWRWLATRHASEINTNELKDLDGFDSQLAASWVWGCRAQIGFEFKSRVGFEEVGQYRVGF